MCRLCLVSERSFLRDRRPFLKKIKKKSEKVKKFQSGIFGLFLTEMASRLSYRTPVPIVYPDSAKHTGRQKNKFQTGFEVAFCPIKS